MRVANPGFTLPRSPAVHSPWSRLVDHDRSRPQVADTLIAVAVAVVTVPWIVEHTDRAPAVWIFDLGLALPLMWRRRQPEAVFVAVAVVALAQWFVSQPLPADAALLVAVFTVALEMPLRAALRTGAVLELGVILACARWSLTGSWIRSLVGLSGLVAAALLAGAVLQARRAQLAELTDRAARLELERDQQARIAAAAERTRIAREMHDVIAHSLAVIVTMADGAAVKLGREPDRAAAAIESIARIGREALGDTRRLVGVLRDDHVGADLSPQPGLDQLKGLIEQLRATGLEAGLEVEGQPFPLAPAAELTIYRLLQEAGTNTLKHAHRATRFDARLRYRYPHVVVEAADDGFRAETVPGGPGHGMVRRTNECPGAGPTAPGHGIAGMQERVALYGGTVESGPGPGGGWRVVASLTAAGGRGG